MQNSQTVTTNNDWQTHKLGDLCEIKTGKKDVNAESKDGEYPFFTCAQEVHKINTFTFDTEAVLVAGNGFFNVKYYDGKFDAYQRTYVLHNFKKGVDGKFIYHFVDSKLSEITKNNRGSTIRYIRLGDLTDQEILLPDIDTQKQIVKSLESAIDKVRASSNSISKSKPLIQKFRQAVLFAAVTGKLTEGWRKNNQSLNEYKGSEFDIEIPTEWQCSKLEDVISDGPQNGLYKPLSSYGGGIRIIRIDNFYDGHVVDWISLKRLSATKQEIESYGLRENDILINRVNSMPFLGKTALIDHLDEPCLFESNMMRISVDQNKVLSEYLNIYLQSHIAKAELRKNAKQAVNQASINQQDVKNVLLLLPPLPEQREIVEQITKYFEFASNIEGQIARSDYKVGKLTQSILAKAFRGELIN